MSNAVSRKQQAQKNSNRSFWIIGGVVAAGALVLALVLINLNSTPRASAPPAQVRAGRVLGSANAPVTIDLFSDFQCPLCWRADLLIRRIAPQYIDSGKVKVVYHNFAFIGDESTRAAEAAECANDQGRFWMYAGYLFDHQTGENVGAFSRDHLKRFAQELNLDTNQFNACFDGNKYAGLIQQELANGRAVGVRATPSFLINGQFLEGLMPQAQFTAALDSFLNNE